LSYYHLVNIGRRLRALREERNLTQATFAKLTGLVGSYISRVENGHSVPTLGTLEKVARALEIPLYQLFYDGEDPPQLPTVHKSKAGGEDIWGTSGKSARYLDKLRGLLANLDDKNRKLLLQLAQKMVRR
jgi:transcriptional regulator with XRE-family HTH domain